MSGDVQPRKRKDKKKKKDDLGIEEPRGTAAALGEGDIFMHSPHEHGTGGHWCAKVIFFSLLAVLVGLIGLIILENRGLSELEANSVESKYSGVLEGWLEDGHDDDHHDEHTLELNHHDDEDVDDDDDHGDESDHDNEDHDEELEDEDNSHDDEDEDDHVEDSNEDNSENLDDDDDQDEIDQDGNDNEDSQEADEDDDNTDQNMETADEDEIEEHTFRRYYQNENQANEEDDDDDDDLQKLDENDDDESAQNNNDDDESTQNYDEDNYHHINEVNDDSQEDNDDDGEDELDGNEDHDDDDSKENEDQDNEEEGEHEELEDSVEVEHIEHEVFNDDVSSEAPAERELDSEDVSNEATLVDEADEDDVEFLEPDELDDDLPEVMPIPITKAKPLHEVEDTPSTEKPQDTLADEEEYERQQEELRKEKEQASQGMWLKLVVGGALLVATQAVLRRATAPRENEDEVDSFREETPLSDRRMTLVAEPVARPPVTSKPQELSRPVVQKEVVRQVPVVKSAPPPEDEEVEEEEEEIVITKDIEIVTADKDKVDKELYSDEEETEDEEEEEIVEEKKEALKPAASKPTVQIREPPKPEQLKETPKVTPVSKKEPPKSTEQEQAPGNEYEDDDVEIIEEEDIDEELEDEEDISDVDDAELLHRLEAKYGRLPEPERPGTKKDGGNSIEDEWPGEPSDSFWRDELDQAEQHLRQGEWNAAAERASVAQLRSSARGRYIHARALDSAADAKRDNALLTKAIAAYLDLLKMNERLSYQKLIEVSDRALDRIKFRGNYLGAEPIYRLLIRRFPDDPTHRNNLTVSFLMANRVDLAEEVIKETLQRWPNDRVALAHHGFILKTLHNKLEEAVDAFTKALEGDAGPANEPRFYYHLGDSLLLLGRFKDAHEVHKRGAKLGHFLSPSQRSLYNVERLKSKPWWNVEKTPYIQLAHALEKSWKEILKEGQAAQELYEKEKEGLKERGEWSQLDLFVRGQEVPNRCSRAPVTCKIVRSEVAAIGCRRGQVKFSSMEAGTHVRPHVGPTNCRLRMHLGLSNTKDTYIRVDQEIRQWQTGKVLMFDDSFEHEVWHNGTGTRLVLIVDVWHPDLTNNERRQLPAI